jgi:hypothetical protein
MTIFSRIDINSLLFSLKPFQTSSKKWMSGSVVPEASTTLCSQAVLDGGLKSELGVGGNDENGIYR